MKNKKILFLSSILLGALSLASCDKALDSKEEKEDLINEGEGTSSNPITPNPEQTLTNPDEGEKKILNEASANEGVSSKDKLDYIREKYGIENHIFDVITIDRLNLLINKNKVDQYGKSVIVFANANNSLSKKALEKINSEAKSLGVERIYYFDLNLAGEYGVDIWDNPEELWPNVEDQTGSKVTQAFLNIKNTLINQTSLKNLESNFDADNDVLLFVNDHEVGTSEIINSLLIEKEEDIVDAKIDDVLGEVIDNIGNYIGTNYSDYDYFNNAIYRSATTNA